MGRVRSARLAGVAAMLVMSASLWGSGSAGASLTNPPANIPPVPNAAGVSTCYYQKVNPARDADSCTALVVQAISNARAQEGVKAMALPSNWGSLTLTEKFFVAVNLERVDWGLPPYLGLNAQLNGAAQVGANNQTDPTGAGGYSVGPGGWSGVSWGGGVDILDEDSAFGGLLRWF